MPSAEQMMPRTHGPIDSVLGGGGGPIDDALEETIEDFDVSGGDHDPLPAFNPLPDLNFDAP